MPTSFLLESRVKVVSRSKFIASVTRANVKKLCESRACCA
jgi:hypothetical protein